jgi:hypothetical protein
LNTKINTFKIELRSFFFLLHSWVGAPFQATSRAPFLGNNSSKREGGSVCVKPWFFFFHDILVKHVKDVIENAGVAVWMSGSVNECSWLSLLFYYYYYYYYYIILAWKMSLWAEPWVPSWPARAQLLWSNRCRQRGSVWLPLSPSVKYQCHQRSVTKLKR